MQQQPLDPASASAIHQLAPPNAWLSAPDWPTQQAGLRRSTSQHAVLHTSAGTAGATTTIFMAAQPSTSHHLFADASRAGSGSLGFHRLHLQPYRRNTHGRIQPPCTTTWEYGHLINGLFYFLSFSFFGRRHRYQGLRHWGNIWELERDWLTVSLQAFFGYRRHMIPRRKEAEL